MTQEPVGEDVKKHANDKASGALNKFRYIALAFGAVIFGILFALLWISGAYSKPFEFFDLPLILTPAITFSVASSMYVGLSLDNFFDDNRDEAESWITKIGARLKFLGVNVLFWVVALVCCMVISFFHGWFIHLFILWLLFMSFCLWDLVCIKTLEVADSVQKDVELGHKYINIPTALSVFIIMLIFVVSDSAGYLESSPNPAPSGDSPPDSQASGSAASIFVSGLVSFHLCVSALSYMVVSTPLYEKLLQRFGVRLDKSI